MEEKIFKSKIVTYAFAQILQVKHYADSSRQKYPSGILSYVGSKFWGDLVSDF